MQRQNRINEHANSSLSHYNSVIVQKLNQNLPNILNRQNPPSQNILENNQRSIPLSSVSNRRLQQLIDVKNRQSERFDATILKLHGQHNKSNDQHDAVVTSFNHIKQKDNTNASNDNPK